jgi:hypothetical protein
LGVLSLAPAATFQEGHGFSRASEGGYSEIGLVVLSIPPAATLQEGHGFSRAETAVEQHRL